MTHLAQLRMWEMNINLILFHHEVYHKPVSQIACDHLCQHIIPFYRIRTNNPGGKFPSTLRFIWHL